jgi:hypothetical protein
MTDVPFDPKVAVGVCWIVDQLVIVLSGNTVTYGTSSTVAGISSTSNSYVRVARAWPCSTHPVHGTESSGAVALVGLWEEVLLEEELDLLVVPTCEDERRLDELAWDEGAADGEVA